MRNRHVELLSRLWADEAGPTAVEYAIMAGLIATVIVGTVGALGAAVNQLFLTVRW
jgi:pilus assembly protein Flp/PilA